MKILLLRPLVQRGVTLCLLPAVIVVYTMSVLAVSGKATGELVLKGNVLLETGKAVTVNGEVARSGRTLFPASVIATPDNTGAVINLGKEGRFELAPGSSFILNADGTPGGTLTAGNLTILSAGQELGFRSVNGDPLSSNVGETITASGSVVSRAQTGPGGVNWWIWALIIGGVATGIIIAATRGDDSSPMSPVR